METIILVMATSQGLKHKHKPELLYREALWKSANCRILGYISIPLYLLLDFHQKLCREAPEQNRNWQNTTHTPFKPFSEILASTEKAEIGTVQIMWVFIGKTFISTYIANL